MSCALITTVPLISLENVGIHRNGKWLVRNINFSVNHGEIVTLIGPNGAGKSTTAKLAIKILEPDEGTVTHASGLRIGYVPQKLTIDWTLPLSVERLMTLTAAQNKQTIEQALEAVGIAHLAKAEIGRLSGGEFQRVLLARALVCKPDLLILDEPVQGVDFIGEAALYALIEKLRDTRQCSILLVSHDLHLVMASTDHVICLNGHICCSGTPKDVTSSKEYTKLFGPRAKEALAMYEHRHDHTHLSDGAIRYGQDS